MLGKRTRPTSNFPAVPNKRARLQSGTLGDELWAAYAAFPLAEREKDKARIEALSQDLELLAAKGRQEIALARAHSKIEAQRLKQSFRKETALRRFAQEQVNCLEGNLAQAVHTSSGLVVQVQKALRSKRRKAEKLRASRRATKVAKRDGSRQSRQRRDAAQAASKMYDALVKAGIDADAVLAGTMDVDMPMEEDTMAARETQLEEENKTLRAEVARLKKKLDDAEETNRTLTQLNTAYEADVGAQWAAAGANILSAEDDPDL